MSAHVAVAGALRQWGVVEVSLRANLSGAIMNPFTVDLFATFTLSSTNITARGFYDGHEEVENQHVFRVRFSPPSTGSWAFHSSCATVAALDGVNSTLIIEQAARPGDHGPVRADGHRFVHADGTEHFSVGTTAYSWAHETAASRNATLATLAGRGRAFNKIRSTRVHTLKDTHTQTPHRAHL